MNAKETQRQAGELTEDFLERITLRPCILKGQVGSPIVINREDWHRLISMAHKGLDRR